MQSTTVDNNKGKMCLYIYPTYVASSLHLQMPYSVINSQMNINSSVLYRVVQKRHSSHLKKIQSVNNLAYKILLHSIYKNYNQHI